LLGPRRPGSVTISITASTADRTRSIGGIGLLLANAFLAALFWLFADWGWLPIDNVAAISWIGLFSVTTILAVGMSWSRLRRGRAPTSG
jgi:hypothetical protein